ncbi:MAG: hypothetical protein H6Q00_1090 [Holophagaceae bacterium]|nr:hypothetical protein [Holophagaceae bacterium]
MSKDEKQPVPESGRRNFLKQSLFAGVAASTFGKLGATQVFEGPEAAPATPGAPAGGYSWEKSPAPIPESRITQTIETDLVILGAGTAGLGTALGAVEAGLKVVVVEKMKTYSARGMHNGAIGTKAQKKAGISIDKDRVVAELMAFSGNRVHQKLVRLWVEKSGEVMDHFCDLAAAKGMGVMVVDTFAVGRKYPDLYPGYSTAHQFTLPGADFSAGNTYIPTQQNFLGMLEEETKKRGAQFLYSTPAQQLIREKSGRVVGVVAKGKGGYIRILAKKGVIIATGSYTENPEMINAWCPEAALPELKIYTPFGGNTGDGLKMALWVGASMQSFPHGTMIHTIPGIGTDIMAGNQSFMQVNKFGERFCNEALPNQTLYNGRSMQPSKKAWAVFDDNWERDHATFKSGFDGPICEDRAGLEDSVKKGLALKADTLEGLARAMGVPAESLKASAARYSKFAKQKKDEDFDKEPFLMFPIEKGPFYALPIKTCLLVTVGGLNVDQDMQVLDKQDNRIPGLYAAGNAMGNFYAHEYPLHCPGLSHGRASILGYLLAKQLAKA